MAGYAPDAIYVDAIYLLQPVATLDFRRKPWERAAEVMRGLKDIAQRRNRPIFQSVQFNRGQTDDDEMSLDNIGQTDEIGQLSSVVIGIKRGETPNERTRRRFRIIKNRHGRDQINFTTNILFAPFDMTEIGETTPQDPDGDWNGEMGEAPAQDEWNC